MNDTDQRYAGTVPPPPTLASSVGAVTLVEGQTFCISGQTGDVSPHFPQGLFVYDTRVLSGFELRINGHPLEPLTVDLDEPFTASFVGRVHPRHGRADSDLVCFRARAIGQGMRERITITNYGAHEASIDVELRCNVDFADLFEVKESRVHPPDGRSYEPTDAGLRFTLDEGAIHKEVELRTSDRPVLDDATMVWTDTLAPKEEWAICIEVIATLGDEVLLPRFRCNATDASSLPAMRLASWRASLPEVHTDNTALELTVRKSGEDLGALRIFDPEHPDVPILAAGAPWFMTIFGRDSLLTAWMALIADPMLAEGVLETLARFQGHDVNPQTEEEPGKILHEMRFGTSARSAFGSGEVYYGSIDATPLFVMLLGELRRWDVADEVIDRLLPHADRALDWVEQFGDRDGDGYVEYVRHSEHGLANQGWKDSWDSIRSLDGELAHAPIALCEVQGYVYAAYVARAHFAREMGDTAREQIYAQKAFDLWARFNEDFWLDEHGWYALGLDADKRPIDALASNLGHCLWTGIVDPARAEIVVKHLMSDEMFSGWGMRTLASSMSAYNPVSYHNGSVWPHDNALAIAGMMRYGFVEEAHRLIRAQLDVATEFGGRLPELFAGFERGHPASPAAYPTSCSPQAWASAAPLLWLRTLLRIDPWAPQREVRIAPELPAWMRRLQVDNIKVGEQTISVRVEGGDVEITGTGDLRVIRTPRITRDYYATTWRPTTERPSTDS